ncbi:MAG: hypothetical protein WCW25_01190 [Patescibacteria group bacterium]|jgi:hypothetical protein
MEQLSYEHPVDACRKLLRGDYMNEYISFFDMLGNIKAKPRLPRGFSERYPDMTFSGLPFKVSEKEKNIITRLDELAVEVRQLLDNPVVNKKLLFKIAIEASKLCERPDLVNAYAEGVEENFNINS